MSDKDHQRISYDTLTRLINKPMWLITALLAIDIAVVGVSWRNTNLDLVTFVLPWYHFLLEHGRFSALAVNFSDYTPPYLYLLSIGTLADGLLEPATIIRAISVSFNAIAAVPVFLFAVAYGWSRGRSILIAFIFVALPEMVVNSLVWGQCDIIYTMFLIAFIYFIVEERQWLATTMLGIAFAFKLQTIFIGPFVLYLLLVRLLRWRHLVMVPLMYLALMLPSALAGRDWGDLLTIFLRQADLYQALSKNAPNPYFVIQTILPDYDTLAMKLGLALAVCVALALVVVFVRRGRSWSRESLVLMATLSLTMMPYVLPKMHERYFFPASAMAFLLTITRASAWPIVVLIQAADLCSYKIFLLGYSHAHLWLASGGILMTCALGLQIRLLLLQRAARPRGAAKTALPVADSRST